ncbi:MBL fold metallo-hydrolase [Sphingomonas sp. TDK1]|uniref:MBL fold metallo-hydrolase n=1 Tax=Sphingomonas sp. TDK1 TaxID=453247 RepID=UPI0007D912B2|nr:MBL fold metallo-hydrolase [Sphingomonas sp. TDK1]OAN66099.1 Zn-dependent hydrolase [Sphingomonas sp. TDK1]
MAKARTFARWLIAALLWIVVALCLFLTLVPPFLDRIYYRGVETGHFDGQRFANPDGETAPAPALAFVFLAHRVASATQQPLWPTSIAVARGRPPARVGGQTMKVTWIGHASVLIQTQGLNILTDPVWSDVAGPFGIGPKRVAAPGVRLVDLPKIDLIVVSHNHYDHLDLATLKRIWQRDRPVIVTGLGNDSVIGQAGVPARGLDWGQRLVLRPGISVVVTRNHHWSSRWFADRNRALWSSFVVTLPGGNLFFAGDTGWGDGKWPAEAAALGPVRFAAIPIGAFRFKPGQMAADAHIGPRDAIRVWEGLGRPWALPIHWGTFRLSWESYRTPPDMLAAMLRCGGTDSGRFTDHAIGQSFDIPAIGTPPVSPSDAGIARCRAEGRFDQFR